MSEIDHAAIGLADESPLTTELAQADETPLAVETPEPTEPEQPEEAKTTEPEPASGNTPFEFGGREWASQEEADQAFRSWEGRIKAEQSKVKDYESRINEYWDYVQAVSKENQQFRTQMETTEPKAEAKDEGIDFQKITRLMEIAKNQGYDPMTIGMKAYAQMAEERFNKTLDEKVKAISEPIEHMQAERQEREADKNMFVWAQGLKASDGQPAYPELQSSSLDEGLVTSVHRIWKELSRTYGPQYAYSTHGFDYAFRLAKDLSPTPVPPSQNRDEQGRFLPARAAASASAEVAGSQPNPVKPNRTESQQMLDELAAIKPVKIGETELGFYE